MKRLISLFTFLLFFTLNANAIVTVNPGSIPYPTLGAAFVAINAGLHTGAVTCDISSSSIEPITAFLNASGVGLASYTSVVITVSAPSTLEGTILGSSVIRLIGADNVTIDGRIGGTGRNLTVRNNSNASNATAIWLSNGSSATDTAGARRNVIRNCEISCNVRVDSSSNNSFGILAGTSTIGTGSNGRNNDSNQYLNNRIIRCRYGIMLNGGAAVNRSDNNTIMGNIVGPDTPGPDNIGRDGIFAQFQDNCLITENLVQNVGGTFAGTTAGSDRIGIAAGSDDWSSTPGTTTGGNYTVTRNKVHGIKEERLFAAIGIQMSSTRGGLPTNNLVANNEIYDVLANATSPDQAFGIGHNGNAGQDLIIFNSIYMVGDLDPGTVTSASQTCGGIRVATVIDSLVTIKDNSIYVDLTSNTPTLLHVCIQMPAATYTFGTATMNYNDYYPASPAVGVNPQMRLGALGTGSLATSTVATLAAWKLTFAPPQDAFSITADPIYALSPPNFLIPQDGTSPLLGAGNPAGGVTIDILGESRSPFTPAIGAYEFDSVALPVELASFTASVNNRDVTLNWTTVSELNNSGFDIERKSTEGSWSKVGFVNGNGTVNTHSNYSFTDRSLATGRYNYRLKQIDFNGNFEYYNLGTEVGVGVPTRFDLSQNYPNPFNPTTSINFDLPLDGKVSIKLFDMMGREVATLVNENKTAGYYTINFNATNLSSGTYFYRIDAGSFVSTKKMMLVK